MSFQKFFIGKTAKSFPDAIALSAVSPKDQFVRMEQVHGNDVAEITAKTLKTNQVIPGVDACYTTLKHTFLSVKSADCLPILISGFGIKNTLVHPFVAAAHAGRKSTDAKIAYLLLEELNKKFEFVSYLKKNQAHLNIWFGPAICENCYQINRDTNTHYNLILQNKEQIVKFFEKEELDPQKHLNLEIEDHCTLHEPEKYYSYRATGAGVKMNYSFVGII